MNVTRRDALKQCFIITVGTAIIPSCQNYKSKPAIVLNNIRLEGDEEKLVTEICETMIPATNTPGARDTLAHLFVLRMVDDMYSEEEQQQFMKGLKEFDKIAKDNLGKSFVRGNSLQKTSLLSSILESSSKDEPENVVVFLKAIKKLTIQGFISSKYYMTKVRVYKLVPGQFYGCVPVTRFNQKELQFNKKDPPIG